MTTFIIEILILVLLLPYLAIPVGALFQGMSFIQGISHLLQHLPFSDLFAKLIETSFNASDFVDFTFLILCDEFLSTLFLGCFYRIFDGFANMVWLRKLPVIRTIIYFVIVVIGGFALEIFDAIGGVGALLTEIGCIILVLIGIGFMSKGVFSGLDMFGTKINIVKGFCGIIIDSILVIIISAYLTLVKICLIKGFDALAISQMNFFVIMVITVIAVGIDATVKYALKKDGL